MSVTIEQALQAIIRHQLHGKESDGVDVMTRACTEGIVLSEKMRRDIACSVISRLPQHLLTLPSNT